METLKLDKLTAVKLYPKAAPEFKTMLESTFGKEAFSEKITDRLKSFGDCCESLGITYLAQFAPGPADKRQEAVNGFEQAIIAVEAINEGWIPDYDNGSEAKWEIWWDLRNNGLVFHCVACWYSHSNVSARLCFKSRELAKWAAEQSWFIEICKKFMVRKP